MLCGEPAGATPRCRPRLPRASEPRRPPSAGRNDHGRSSWIAPRPLTLARHPLKKLHWKKYLCADLWVLAPKERASQCVQESGRCVCMGGRRWGTPAAAAPSLVLRLRPSPPTPPRDPAADILCGVTSTHPEGLWPSWRGSSRDPAAFVEPVPSALWSSVSLPPSLSPLGCWTRRRSCRDPATGHCVEEEPTAAGIFRYSCSRLHPTRVLFSPGRRGQGHRRGLPRSGPFIRSSSPPPFFVVLNLETVVRGLPQPLTPRDVRTPVLAMERKSFAFLPKLEWWPRFAYTEGKKQLEGILSLELNENVSLGYVEVQSSGELAGTRHLPEVWVNAW